jgi:hypothetical protein
VFLHIGTNILYSNKLFSNAVRESVAQGTNVVPLSLTFVCCKMLSPKTSHPPVTLRRKRNFKNLSLQNSPIVIQPASPTGHSKADVNSDQVHYSDLSGQLQDLEIGLELRLDLRAEDIETLEELGAGNGGTVCKVLHIPTKTIMAKKVKENNW